MSMMMMIQHYSTRCDLIVSSSLSPLSSLSPSPGTISINQNIHWILLPTPENVVTNNRRQELRNQDMRE